MAKNLLVFLCTKNGCQVLRHYRLVEDVIMYVITLSWGAGASGSLVIPLIAI